MNRVLTNLTEVLYQARGISETSAGNALIDLCVGRVSGEHLLQNDEAPIFLNTSVDDVGKLSYTTRKKVVVNSWDNKFAACPTNAQRVKAKVGRTLKKIFTTSYLEDNDIDNNDIETFTSQLKSLWNTNDDCFDLNTPFYKYEEDYTHPDAQEGEGTLGDSCMRYENCIADDYFELYEGAPCRLVSYDEGEGITSRAILWTTDDGTKLLDRIYQTHDGDVDKFKLFAKKNNWWYKQRQSYREKDTWVSNGGERLTKNFIIQVQHFEDITHFPYIDTFTFGFEDDDGDCYLTNSMEHAYNVMGVTNFREFTCVSGGYSWKEGHEVNVIGDDFEMKTDIDFSGDFVVLSDRDISRSSVLTEAGRYSTRSHTDKDVRVLRSAQETFIDLDGEKVLHHGWYHVSELKYSDYDCSWYHMNEEFVDVDGLSCDVPKNICTRYKGEWIRKKDLMVYVNLDNEIDYYNCRTSPMLTLVKDYLGVTRVRTDCDIQKFGYVPLNDPILRNLYSKRQLEINRTEDKRSQISNRS